MDLDTIIQQTDFNKTPSGCFCYFVKVDDDWGLKLWQDKGSRTIAYNRQKKAAEFGLGPAVGEKFSVGKWHGYVTQVAETVVDPYASKMSDAKKRELRQQREILDGDLDFQADLQILVKGLERALPNCDIQDMHYANVGRINGKLVCIDFGFD